MRRLSRESDNASTACRNNPIASSHVLPITAFPFTPKTNAYMHAHLPTFSSSNEEVSMSNAAGTFA